MGGLGRLRGLGGIRWDSIFFVKGSYRRYFFSKKLAN